MRNLTRFIVTLFILALPLSLPARAKTIETLTVGGGCFWCLEAIFQEVRGVEKVVSGYSGGGPANPTYKDVCTGKTGHAEVIQITYDADQVSLKDLLEMFYTIHDPTTLNRQGDDVGTQYRSAIFYGNPKQKAAAEEAKMAAHKEWKKPIVTEIVPYKAFYAAENYHQNYFKTNPKQPYCSIVISPKVQKFHKLFAKKLKAS